MRKTLYILAALVSILLSADANAQTYYRITHETGTVNITPPNMNVTATKIGSPLYQLGSYCGITPYYQIGAGNTSGWNYSFAPRPASHIRLRVVDVQDNDSIRVSVNGTPYDLNNATTTTIGPYPGTCAAAASCVVTPQGWLSATNFTGPAGIEIIIDVPTGVTSIALQQMNAGPLASGVVYSIEFADDVCTKRFDAVLKDNLQPCEGTDLVISATNLPNTTYSWTATTVPTWTSTGSSTITRPNVTSGPIYNGTYTVTAQTAGCPNAYTDAVLVQVRIRPILAKPTATPNPVCRGGDVQLDAKANLGSGGSYDWTGPQSFTNINNPVIVNVQVADVGYYVCVATTTDGCKSNPDSVYVDIFPDVIANWDFDTSRGCKSDTLNVHDLSQGASSVKWVWGDGSPDGSGTPFDTHVYYLQNTYNVKLIATNSTGQCKDSMIKTIEFVHPLTAGFTVDDDTICQHTLVTFTNTTTTAVSGYSHGFEWNFGDRSPTENQLDVTHMYDLAGIWTARLVVTDFLGCKDTAEKLIFVDSTGAIYFNPDDSVVCPGQEIVFTGDYSRLGNIGNTWDYGDEVFSTDTNFSKHSYDFPGIYTVKFTSLNRICKDTFATRDIKVMPYPKVDLGPDTSICPNGKPVKIVDHINAGNPNAKWKWNNTVESTTPSIEVRHQGIYSATVEIDGCSTTDSIEVFKNCYVDIPNAFTPNGDGTGDYFLPRQLLSKGVTTFEMTIFDRWGQKVFETKETGGRGWDGKFNGTVQPVGVYIYLINVTFVNGTSEKYQGNVSLLR